MSRAKIYTSEKAILEIIKKDFSYRIVTITEKEREKLQTFRR
jgi:hypothetical protein